jgi:hypothetical protein
MVSVLALSVVDLEFDTRSDQTKVYEMLFVASPFCLVEYILNIEHFVNNGHFQVYRLGNVIYIYSQTCILG